MARLIDADEIPYAMSLIDWMAGGGTEKNVAYKFIIDMMPTIDPVKHGHWIDHETEDGIMLGRDCSVCGAWLVLDSDFNFCPECGSSMDEVSE